MSLMTMLIIWTIPAGEVRVLDQETNKLLKVYSPPPPMPCTARATINHTILCAAPHSAEPICMGLVDL